MARDPGAPGERSTLRPSGEMATTQHRHNIVAPRAPERWRSRVTAQDYTAVDREPRLVDVHGAPRGRSDHVRWFEAARQPLRECGRPDRRGAQLGRMLWERLSVLGHNNHSRWLAGVDFLGRDCLVPHHLLLAVCPANRHDARALRDRILARAHNNRRCADSVRRRERDDRDCIRRKLGPGALCDELEAAWDELVVAIVRGTCVLRDAVRDLDLVSVGQRHDHARRPRREHDGSADADAGSVLRGVEHRRRRGAGNGSVLVRHRDDAVARQRRGVVAQDVDIDGLRHVEPELDCNRRDHTRTLTCGGGVAVGDGGADERGAGDGVGDREEADVVGVDEGSLANVQPRSLRKWNSEVRTQQN
eukprot:1701883-Rhodomonas_salina.3